jgi:hypothetical protein
MGTVTRIVFYAPTKVDGRCISGRVQDPRRKAAVNQVPPADKAGGA